MNICKSCCQNNNSYVMTNIFLLDHENIGDLVCVNLFSYYYNNSKDYHNALILSVDSKKKSFTILQSDKQTVKTIKVSVNEKTTIYFNN